MLEYSFGTNSFFTYLFHIYPMTSLNHQVMRELLKTNFSIIVVKTGPSTGQPFKKKKKKHHRPVLSGTSKGWGVDGAKGPMVLRVGGLPPPYKSPFLLTRTPRFIISFSFTLPNEIHNFCSSSASLFPPSFLLVRIKTLPFLFCLVNLITPTDLL